jgi:hypothetical protein
MYSMSGSDGVNSYTMYAYTYLGSGTPTAVIGFAACAPPTFRHPQVGAAARGRAAPPLTPVQGLRSSPSYDPAHLPIVLLTRPVVCHVGSAGVNPRRGAASWACTARKPSFPARCSCTASTEP